MRDLNCRANSGQVQILDDRVLGEALRKIIGNCLRPPGIARQCEGKSRVWFDVAAVRNCKRRSCIRFCLRGIAKERLAIRLGSSGCRRTRPRLWRGTPWRCRK